MSLWFRVGELFGWMSEDKPEVRDVFPPEEVMGRNGGTTNEGAIENYWHTGFELSYEDEDITDHILEEDWEDEDQQDEEL